MLPSSHQLSLKLMERCPSCQAQVPEAGIHILSESDRNMLAHLSCMRCLSNYLTYIVHHPQGLIGNAVRTDLTYAESLKTLHDQPMSEDDFLELFRTIQQPTFIQRLASIKQ